MDMKTRVKWIEGVAFAGESGSGHAVVLDGAADGGGRNVGMRPMEMLLNDAAALGFAKDEVRFTPQANSAGR